MLNQDRPSSPPSSPDHTSPLAWSSEVSALPLEPGVYWFLDENGRVLYVGKAKHLKHRVSSYRQLTHLSPRIKQMVQAARQLKHSVLGSELEALLVEAELIRIHQPPYNILLKDDKTPLYIHLTHETYPRVLTRRKKEIQTKVRGGTLLGPFPSSHKVREVLKLIRPIFPWCNQEGKPCFYYHLGLCPGACVGAIRPAQYAQTIAHLVDFLRGKKQTVIKDMTEEMKQAALEENFEQAALLRDRVAMITEITQRTYTLRPDLSLPHLQLDQAEERLKYLRNILTDYLSLPVGYPLRRIECYDVSNISGAHAAVAMVVFVDGQPDTDAYRQFNIRTQQTPNDFAMLQEALVRRQNHPEWGKPDLIIIDGGKGQLSAVLKYMSWPCPVISIAKDPDRLIIPGAKLWKFAPTHRVSHDTTTEISPRHHELKLPSQHPALILVQQLRDEAHRFSRRQHHRRHLKSLLQ